MSFLPSLLILGIVALVAANLASSRPSPPALFTERATAAKYLALAIAAQVIHFAEETFTGFDERFPALFGLAPIPQVVFIGFNVAWIAAWLVSVVGIRSGNRAAFFAAWFLAIAGMMNMIAHPVLALVSAGYFPGLFTSPLIGIAAILLWRKLDEATPR